MTKNSEFPYSLLIVDDEAGIRHGLKNWFKKHYDVFESGTSAGALELASAQMIDIAILDIRLKGERDGILLFKELKRINPKMVVLLMTGYGNVEDAVNTLKDGAHDYFLKPVDNHKLLTSIQNALEIRELKTENQGLKKQLKTLDGSHAFIGETPQVRAIMSKADKIKNNPVTVLINGESGTGKEVLARYLHFTSDRSTAPFVALNCAAISESLLLSELFGHEKGAFTGANARKIGKFELADKGHLFMDEIGDMSLSNQAALLRVLETQSFERVGGNQHIKVDTRVVTATNQDLPAMVAAKKFREDLYYRLNVVSFMIPALRDRREDIPLLVEHFRQVHNGRYKKEVQGFSDDAKDMLMAYDWPGNIRELNNVINQVILLSTNEVITPEEIDYSPIQVRPKSFVGTPVNFSNVESLQQASEDHTNAYEKQLLEHYLEHNDYNQSKTAKILKITRKTLARKIQKYGIELKK